MTIIIEEEEGIDAKIFQGNAFKFKIKQDKIDDFKGNYDVFADEKWNKYKIKIADLIQKRMTKFVKEIVAGGTWEEDFKSIFSGLIDLIEGTQGEAKVFE